MKTLKIFRLDPKAVLPTRNLATDAGIDVYALEDTYIPVETTKIIKTGIAVNIESGFYAKVEDRSGTSLKGLRTGGGVVDTGYSGEVGIIMHNLNNESYKSWFSSGYMVRKGDRIAQLVIMKCEFPVVEEVSELWTSERGTNGFNSSGR